MYSVIISSRKKDRPDSNLPKLLDSFIEYTTEEERTNSEFLIKFDTDDNERPDLESYKEKLSIKEYTWDRHGGRHSLHEVQNVLFKFVDDKVTWVQVIADDFEFTMDGFVDTILKQPIQYIGVIVVDARITNGYAPCFSRKFLEICGGCFGPDSNVDEFVSELLKVMEKNGLNLGVPMLPYYRRARIQILGEDQYNSFNKLCKENREKTWELMARNIMIRVNLHNLRGIL